MNWKDVGQTVGKFAPVLGTLLGGPAGASIGALVASALGTNSEPDDVSKALQINPDAAVKIKQIEADHEEKLKSLLVTAESNRLQADTVQIQSVNQTMQIEAKADHWPTYSWRPFIGFMFGAYVGSLFILPLFGKQPVTLSADITLAIGAILGVASYFRGKMQADPAMVTDNRG